MNKQENKITELAPIQGKAKALIPEMHKSATNAVTALSGVKKVETQEDADKTNTLLAKVRNTYKKLVEQRKSITDPLDQFKKDLMEFEKQIENKKGADNEYMRVLKLMNDRVNKIEQQRREEQAKIEQEKAHKSEVERIKIEQVSNVEISLSEALIDGENALIKLVQNTTLENFDAQLKKLNYKPNLKLDLFKKWIDVEHNSSLVSKEEFESICQACIDHNYEKANKSYIEASTELLATYTQKLKDKKPQLEEAANATEEEKVKIAELQRLKEAKEEKERKDKIEEQRNAAEEAKRDAQAEATMNIEFDSQVKNQSLEEAQGVRKNVSYELEDSTEPIDAIKTLSNVMIHCITHENAKGIYKTDKDGNVKTDADGKKEYVDGVSYWLKELARLNKEADIKGVKRVESVSSIVRS